MLRRIASAAVAVAFLVSAGAALAKAKTYQFTGEVTKVDKSSFTVKKDTESWEFDTTDAKDAKVKVGDKVTVKYRMVPTDVTKK